MQIGVAGIHPKRGEFHVKWSGYGIVAQFGNPLRRRARHSQGEFRDGHATVRPAGLQGPGVLQDGGSIGRIPQRRFDRQVAGDWGACRDESGGPPGDQLAYAGILTASKSRAIDLRCRLLGIACFSTMSLSLRSPDQVGAGGEVVGASEPLVRGGLIVGERFEAAFCAIEGLAGVPPRPKLRGR